MHKGDGLCLQIETGVFMAVELIAHNRTAQPLGVCTMHPQLVRAPGMRVKGKHRDRTPVTRVMCQHPIFGDSPFPVFMIHNLTRAVQRVTAQGQIDDAMICGHGPLYHRQVFLLDGSGSKLVLQMMIAPGHRSWAQVATE